jgi:hypothetical protein
MAVPYTFGTATAAIPLSQLDSNFATTITLGNTAIQLGNTVTTLNNMTLANVTISGGTSSITSNSISNGTSNVSIATSGGAVTVATNGATAVTVDTSQNVGIGTTTPTAGYKLNVGSSSAVTTLNGAAITLFASGSLTSNVGGVLNFRPQLGTTISDIFNLSICAYDHSGDGNADGLSINGSDGVSFSTGGNSRSERMRVGSDGTWYLNTTDADAYIGSSTSQTGFTYRPGLAPRLSLVNDFYINRSNGDGNIFEFRRNGSAVGRITVSSGATAYVTSSDYRLKQDIVPMMGALAKVSALNPVTYKWKSDGSSAEGFIAHELAEICPQAVSGAKDAVDADGNPAYQGIDTSFLVATLTAAIQEQQALIASLTARIAALEVK